MIDGLKPYRTMKDSGVPWLGEVPEHWPVAALRHRYDQALGKMLDSKRITGSHSLPYLRNTDVQWNRINTSSLPTMDIPEPEYGRYTLQMGDLLVCEGGEVGRCAIWTGQLAVCGYQKALHRLRPRNHDTDLPRFMYYVLRAATKLDAFNDGHVSTIAHLTGDKLRAQRFPYPPFEEQAAIVRFLDHADRRIRRYIHAKQKLIKLLEEQKQATIHRAITRSLDPNVRLSPSGVEWLGDVPEHWEVKRCRYIFREVDSRSLDGSEQHLSMSQRLGLVPSHLVENRTLVSESYVGGKLCQVGDLVLNRLKAHLGVFALARHAGVISPDYTVLRPRDAVGVEYFERILCSTAFRRELRIRAKGIVEGFWRLYTDDFYDIRMPVPPPQERREIVNHFVAETSKLERAVLQAERKIELLREYRTRLIADVVTGKLDVREAAARLPNESEEPELLDEAGVENYAEAADVADTEDAREETEA